jgi:hypothetical protein
MTRSEQLAQAFVREVQYLQGSIYSLPYDVRSRQWLSVTTVASLLAHYEGLNDEQFKKDCGIDADLLNRWKPAK